MESKGFRCDVARGDDGVRITLEGELDLATAPEVEAALREAADDYAAPERCVLDLRELTFMDSSGLRAILSANAVARRDGRVLQIVAGPPAVQRVFEICGVSDSLRFVDP
jgi:anti-anti-sigma factor